jgi:replicative DNA helicase
VRRIAKSKASGREDAEPYNFHRYATVSAGLVRNLKNLRQKPVVASGLLPNPGFVPGTFTVLCSMSPIGKTAYLTNLAIEAQSRGMQVAVFLPDYTPGEFVLRSICVRQKLDYSQVHSGFVSRKTSAQIAGACKEPSLRGIYISRRHIMSESDIEQDVKEISKELLAAGKRLDLVLIDSLNYVQKEECDICNFSGLCGLAKDQSVAIVGAFGVKSQDRCITLADIRAAGVDERETDSVLLLNRPEYYDRTDPMLRGMAEVETLYSADYWTGTLLLKFDARTLSFARNLIQLSPMSPESEF